MFKKLLDYLNKHRKKILNSENKLKTVKLLEKKLAKKLNGEERKDG
jgi:hypothetical protein